jgi:hypothetical protein
VVANSLRYPVAIGEFETVHKLLDGFSIARFGDGEFKMADGKGYRREAANSKLASELNQILQSPKPSCLVGIPTMDERGAKFQSWVRHYERFKGMLSPSVQYYSSFISRPDSAQWIMVREYAELLQRAWVGRRAVVICEPDNSMLDVVQRTAMECTHIACPSSGAYAFVKQFYCEVVKLKPDVAILCIGPSATCLAHRLSHKVQAIDIGSAGGFLRKLLQQC